MMKRIRQAVRVAAIFGGLLVPVYAEYIVNGDFETDGYASAGLNNQSVQISGWTGPYTDGNLRYDTTGGGWLPEQPNTAIRLLNNTSVHQTVSASWGADDTFTISLNACEVWWKSAAAGNGIWLSLRNTCGAEYFTHLIDLDGTHGGEGTSYASWQENQTFSVQVSGAELINGTANGSKGFATATTIWRNMPSE